MDIQWHGNTCFTLKDKGVTVVLNPDKDAGKMKGDIVLTSLDGDIKVDGEPIVFDWPGEYEVKGIPIVGFRAWTKSKTKEEDEGKAGDPTLIFYFEMGGVKICHLGELGHVLTSDMVKEIGDVDILMISGGEGSNLGQKKAAEVLEAIDPRAVVPMGNGGRKEFLKEFGAENVAVEDKFSIKAASELPDDKRQYIVLNKV